MQKYRIAIQTVTGKQYRHYHNIVLSTDDIVRVIKLIRGAAHKEIKNAEVEFNKYLSRKTKNKMFKEIIASDLYDKKAKGKDISHEEFLKNEMDTCW